MYVTPLTMLRSSPNPNVLVTINKVMSKSLQGTSILAKQKTFRKETNGFHSYDKGSASVTCHQTSFFIKLIFKDTPSSHIQETNKSGTYGIYPHSHSSRTSTADRSTRSLNSWRNVGTAHPCTYSKHEWYKVDYSHLYHYLPYGTKMVWREWTSCYRARECRQ